MENRKKFMNQLATTLKITTPSDWGKVTLRHIYDLGGSALLTAYYRGSLFSCLKSIYNGIFEFYKSIISKKDIEWKQEWFSNIPRYPKLYFNSEENCRIFMEELARNNNVHKTSDWRKVSSSLIKNNGGRVSNRGVSQN